LVIGSMDPTTKFVEVQQLRVDGEVEERSVDTE
jgi:hypothetical protein